MIRIGLTGSIGMGKTWAARQLRRLGIPVFDSDAAIHRLTGRGGAAVPLIALMFPQVVFDGAVDRPRLGAQVFHDSEALKRLEEVLHPMLRREQQRFLQQCRRRRHRLVGFDIPLLFETGADRWLDRVLLVRCPRFLQTQRVMARSGMTHGKLQAIRQHQWPEWRKERHADAVIPTGIGKRFGWVRLIRLIRQWQSPQSLIPVRRKCIPHA